MREAISAIGQCRVRGYDPQGRFCPCVFIRKEGFYTVYGVTPGFSGFGAAYGVKTHGGYGALTQKAEKSIPWNEEGE